MAHYLAALMTYGRVQDMLMDANEALAAFKEVSVLVHWKFMASIIDAIYALTG